MELERLVKEDYNESVVQFTVYCDGKYVDSTMFSKHNPPKEELLNSWKTSVIERHLKSQMSRLLGIL